MATVKQVLGRVKGDKGDTGPTNAIIASVYSFKVTQSPEIPTDGWMSTLPDVQQGDYVWCRTQCTWEEGPDSTLLSVGYIGKDGDIASVDIFDEYGRRIQALEDMTIPVSKGGTGTTTLEGAQAKLGITKLREELTERLDGINDLTTGMNLLRQTRDFIVGDDYVYPGANSYVRNGFYLPSDWTVTKDEEGFTVISCTRSGLTADTAAVSHCSVIPCKKGDVFTFSVDFMSENVKEVDSPSIVSALVMGKDAPGTLESFDISISSINAKDGEWKRIQRTMNVTAEGAAYLVVRLRLGRNGNVNFRKPAAAPGKINNLLYSVSPLDMALNPINDITTGTNLLRNTRDLTLGSIPYTNSGVSTVRYVDGLLKATTFTVVKESDGFSSVTSSPLSTATSYQNLSVVNKSFKSGDFITLYFEYKINGNLSDYGDAICTIAEIAKTGEGSNLKVISISELRIHGENKANEWVKASYIYMVPKDIDFEQSAIIMTLDAKGSRQSSTTISFKKPAVYEGAIENPEWSANPFDYASSWIEKGSPLLLGSVPASNFIPGSADINEYVIPGVYVCDGDGYVATVKNLPSGVTASFKLIVEEYRPRSTGAKTHLLRTIQIQRAKWIQSVTKNSADDVEYTFGTWTQYASSTNVGYLTYEAGGTNANSLAGAKTNLGITALEQKVATLEAQVKALTS